MVITIIVLLILASVSIAMLTGENGILTQANEAKEQNEIGKEKEMVNLAVTSLVGQGYTEGKNMLTSENLQKEMDKIAGKDKTSVTGTMILKVEFPETKREYYVNSKGEIIEPIDYTNIYTYTEDGYITGVKSEYFKQDISATNKKYATTNKLQSPRSIMLYYLIDELNGILKIPNEINNTKIIGIAEGAFECINNLKEVTIEDGIKILGNYSFSCCYNLTNIELPYTLTDIGGRAFYDNSSIETITIPSRVKEISERAFENCYNLVSIIIEKEEGTLTNEPWGANNAAITYVGDKLLLEFTNKYLSNKNENELEEIILQNNLYIGTFEEFLKEEGTTIEELKQEAQNSNITYVEYLKKKIIAECSEFINLEYECSNLGLLDKSTQELEQIYVEKAKENGATEEIGEFNTFDEMLEKLEMTRQEFEQMYKEQGCRTEDFFLKVEIVRLEYA